MQLCEGTHEACKLLITSLSKLSAHKHYHSRATHEASGSVALGGISCPAPRATYLSWLEDAIGNLPAFRESLPSTTSVANLVPPRAPGHTTTSPSWEKLAGKKAGGMQTTSQGAMRGLGHPSPAALVGHALMTTEGNECFLPWQRGPPPLDRIDAKSGPQPVDAGATHLGGDLPSTADLLLQFWGPGR